MHEDPQSSATECIQPYESEAIVEGRMHKDRMLDLEDHAKNCGPCRTEFERARQARNEITDARRVG